MVHGLQWFDIGWFTQNLQGYHQIFNIRCTLTGNEIVDHSDVVGASPVDLLQLHLHSWLNTWLQWIGEKQLHKEMKNI